jgi:NADH dehydrogenase
MEWTVPDLQSHFVSLINWISFASLFGLCFKAASYLMPLTSIARVQTDEGYIKNRRIVILGGGFGGMKTAEVLERILEKDDDASITLISETNSLLFTPMLAEVAGSSLEPSHISTPLRSALRQTTFVRGHVVQIDLAARTVRVNRGDDSGADTEIYFDCLVLALGSESNYLGLPGVDEFAFDFKSLLDAIRIRNHVVSMFERADAETDPAVKKRLLTFVIAGGGFAGVELAGALNDFGHGILADYRNVSREELSIILVHSRERILPELSESLASYALEKMKQRGVNFRLGKRLVSTTHGLVTLTDEQIPAETLVWTAGTTPNSLLSTINVAKDNRGALVVDETLALGAYPLVWALGDSAAVTDARTQKPCPPTAQFALREAETVARNIRARLRGKAGEPFHFDSLGSLCVIGHQTACAELTLPFARTRSVRFSGLLAWLMWRSIYVAKLPGIERKIRVLMAWTLEIFFPRDVVQTIELGGEQ